MNAQGNTSTSAAVYVRISADPEGERAGVERQRAECEALADRLGLEVVAVFEDNDTSAYSGQPRPGFETMLEGAQAGDFAHVIAWASDRIYRRMADLVRITAELAPHVRIHTVAGGEVDLTTADGIMQAQVLGAVAEHESRRKGERVQAKARQRAERDRRATSGRRLTGWRWADPCPAGEACQHSRRCETPGVRPRAGSRAGLVPDEVEADILRAAYADVRRGLSMNETWRRAVAAGLTISDARTLRYALLNPMQAGLVAYRGDIVGEAANGLHIIDRATWDAVRTILTDPRRRTTPGRPVETVLGGGLLVCGRCGGNMTALNDGYRCGPGKHLHRRHRDVLDTPVLDLVGEAITEVSGRGLLVLAPGADDRTQDLRAEVAEVENRLSALAGMVAAGELDPADYRMATTALRERLKSLTARLGRRAGRPALTALASNDEGARAAWDALRAAGDTAQLRAVLAETIDRITLTEEGVMLVTWAAWLGLDETEIDPRPAPKRLSIKARREVVGRRYREGATINAIADELGCYRATIRGDLVALGLREGKAA